MDKKMFVMIVNTVTNASLSLFKIVIGFLFQSSLLIADGLHSASDLLTDLFAIVGLRFASMPQDEEHPFGHGSLEYASSLTVAILIFGMACQLFLELIQDWSIPTTHVSMTVLGASFVAFIVKLILSTYVLYQAKKLDSHTLLSSGIESKADAYSTIVVIVGLIVTHLGIIYDMPLLVYAEKVATLFVVMMLFKAALTIYLASARGIAGGVASDEIKQEYLEQVMACDPELEVSEIVVLKQGINYSIHLKLSFQAVLSLQTVSNRMESLKSCLYKDNRIAHVTTDFTIISV
ncbi:MAG: cation diffusion facilitator family transporter [Pseudomonadota bacterium]